MPEVTYVGTCSTLEEKKSGWYRIHIMVPGKQYAIKADTKLEHLIAAARKIRDDGLVATWTIEEYDSENINPNSGKPYTERRLNGVEEGASAAAQKAAAEGPQPHHEAVHFADKDRLISRQVCLKVAGHIIQHESYVDAEDAALEVMRAAQRLEQWLYRDIDQPPFE